MLLCFAFLHFWSLLCRSLPDLEQAKGERRGGEKTRLDASHFGFQIQSSGFPLAGSGTLLGTAELRSQQQRGPGAAGPSGAAVG